MSGLNAGRLNSYINDYTIANFLDSKVDLLSGNILDIGCGRMKFKERIESVNHNTYIGLDLVEGEFSDKVTADVYWDGVNMPIDANAIDGAILFEVLEHCPDPVVVVKEAFRVLKPGGILLFSTPFTYQFHGVPYDFVRMTPAGLKNIFSQAGFTQVSFQYGGLWDASIAQVLGTWVSKRPMPLLLRKILKKLFVPLFKILLFMDKKELSNNKGEFLEGLMVTNTLGVAKK